VRRKVHGERPNRLVPGRIFFDSNSSSITIAPLTICRVIIRNVALCSSHDDVTIIKTVLMQNDQDIDWHIGTPFAGSRMTLMRIP
jgi:hypothetical protein